MCRVEKACCVICSQDDGTAAADRTHMAVEKHGWEHVVSAFVKKLKGMNVAITRAEIISALGAPSA